LIFIFFKFIKTQSHYRVLEGKSMAKAPAKQAAPAEAAEPKKSGKKPLLLVAVVLLLAAGGGGAAWYFLMGRAQEPAKAAKAEEAKPIFLTMDQFTVNLQGDNRYLAVSMDLKVANEKVTDALKLHMPEVRNGMNMVLSSKHAEEVATTEGKQKLAEELRAAANKPLALADPNQGVTGVYFTSFVIQ
jgi:flagellar FliL protein